MSITIPSFLQPRTLQQRNTLYLMLPTLLVLLVMGLVSTLLVRQVLLGQWEQMVIARMQRAAYEVDLRLLRPKRLLMLYQQQAGEEFNRHVSQFIMDRLEHLEGVVQVNLVWADEEQAGIGKNGAGHSAMPRPGGMRYYRMNPLEVTTPVYDAEFEGRIISLVSEFRDKNDREIGQIQIKISFYDLVDTMVQSSWWKSNRAFLVDQSGNVLTRTALLERNRTETATDRFGTASELERKTLAELQKNESGIVFGKGMPPDEVSGYYRLREAPWTMVVIVPGESALQPILKFRSYYFITGGLGILLALLLIRMTTTGTARAIRRVSDAARELANGNFSPPLGEDREDEVGELTRNFNIMTRQLQERMQLQEAMSVAREVQQNLLPQSSYRVEGIDVSGSSLYCQETGGDYFDLLPDQQNPQRVSVVIGDVVGHGIGAALLMASIRAFVRCRTLQPGSPEEVITDVNELLCRDTEKSGNFVSLFYLIIDRAEQMLRWVRCGHDPAIVYDPNGAQFSELRGEGLVLGFDNGWQYREHSMALGDHELIILLGSDGVWEAENGAGEQFGRERVKELLAGNSHRPSDEITKIITEEVTRFRGAQPQGDDITLVVVRTAGTHL